MKSRTEEQVEAQGGEGAAWAVLARIRQSLLPMMAGMAAAKKDVLDWVHAVGLAALDELFEADAQAIAGPKGKHRADRKHHRWGTTPTELPFGGRRIRVRRPRVRAKSGKREVALPSVAYFQEVDRLPERVMNQVLLGVSTRGYEASLEPPPPGTKSRGTSKSAAGRHLIVCKGCGGPLKIVAYITDELSIRRILDHLGLSPPEQEKPPPARDVVRVPVDDEERKIQAG